MPREYNLQYYQNRSWKLFLPIIAAIFFLLPLLYISSIGCAHCFWAVLSAEHRTVLFGEAEEVEQH
jgi:hypothetical protein